MCASIVIQLVALSFAYLVALIATKEIGGDDLKMIRRVIKSN